MIPVIKPEQSMLEEISIFPQMTRINADYVGDLIMKSFGLILLFQQAYEGLRNYCRRWHRGARIEMEQYYSFYL